uniref:Uncharacterized protein n=1 Tax=Anopheles dirus TaxID=7168 RepID=A0A182NSQ8_9DIPT
MLGSTANGRLMGPGVGSSTSSSSSSSSSQSHTSQQQHQLGHHPFPGLPAHHQHHHPLQSQHPALAAHHHRSIWPTLAAPAGRTAFELQPAPNGEGRRAPTVVMMMKI